MEKKIFDLVVDEKLSTVLPPLHEAEYRTLESNVITYGCLDPVKIWNGKIVDGNNRYRICHEHGIHFAVEEMEFESETEAIIWIIENQNGRRSQTAFERCEVVLRYEEDLKAEAKQRQIRKPRNFVPQNSAEQKRVESRDELAALAGVSHDTLMRVKKLLELADEETKTKLRRGELTINKAYTKLMKERKEAVESAKKERAVVETAKEEEAEEEAPAEEEAEEEVPAEEEAEEEVPVEEEAEEEVPVEEETEEEVPAEEEAKVVEPQGEEAEEEEQIEIPGDEEIEDEETGEKETEDTKEPVLKLRETPLPPPPRRRAGDIIPGYGIAEFMPDDMKGFQRPPDSVYDLQGIPWGGFTEEEVVGEWNFGQVEARLGEIADRFVMRTGTIVNKMNPDYYRAENIARLRKIVTSGYDYIMKMLDEKEEDNNE